MMIRHSLLPNMHELQKIRDEAALGRLFETHADPEGVLRLNEDELRGKGPALSYGLHNQQLRYVGTEDGQLIYQRTDPLDSKTTQAGTLPQHAPAA